jgi:glycosyltransferase involved in cell wall biosynthesis
MTVSIVLTTFNRPNQLNNTLTSIVRQQYPALEIIVVDDGFDVQTPQLCARFPVQYIKLNRPQSWKNSSLPNNIGIRRATGNIIIVQNAECMHIDSCAVERLAALVTDNNAVFAHVQAINSRGTPIQWYCGPEKPVAFFFCGAMKRDRFLRMRGFDEDFTGPGFDDDDFQARLMHDSVEFVFSDILVHHQWHLPSPVEYLSMQAVFEKKLADMQAGRIGTARNLNREWGLCK